MGDSARQLRKTGRHTPALELQIVDGDEREKAPGMPCAPPGGEALRLSCLVTLQCPSVRSSVERRRHLRDSLVNGTASHNAAILARDPHFWDFLQQINLMAYAGEIDSRRARHFINRVCGVNGRYDFKHNPEAEQRYLTLVEQPFLCWLLAGGCD